MKVEDLEAIVIAEASELFHPPIGEEALWIKPLRNCAIAFQWEHRAVTTPNILNMGQ